MKKITLVLATMLLSVTFAIAAKPTSDLNHSDKTSINRYSQPIMFVEQGIEFLIFQNGDLDLNRKRSVQYSKNYFRKNSNRKSYNNRIYGVAGVEGSYGHNRRAFISYDRFGRIRNIDNIYISYDHYGRVKRIGSVIMSYYYNKLEQVGRLRLQYNRWGELISTTGQVNYSNQGCGFCGTTGCATSHIYENHNDDYYDDWKANNDYNYYKKGNKKRKNRRSVSH